MLRAVSHERCEGLRRTKEKAAFKSLLFNIARYVDTGLAVRAGPVCVQGRGVTGLERSEVGGHTILGRLQRLRDSVALGWLRVGEEEALHCADGVRSSRQVSSYALSVAAVRKVTTSDVEPFTSEVAQVVSNSKALSQRFWGSGRALDCCMLTGAREWQRVGLLHVARALHNAKTRPRQ